MGPAGIAMPSLSVQPSPGLKKNFLQHGSMECSALSPAAVITQEGLPSPGPGHEAINPCTLCPSQPVVCISFLS